jgi:DNA polymerase-1
VNQDYVTTAHKWLNIPDDRFGKYNAIDTVATAMAIQPLQKEMVSRGMAKYWGESVMPLVPVVLAMQDRGICVDQAAMSELRSRLLGDLRDLDRTLCLADSTGTWAEACGTSKNSLNSPAKLAKVLFDHFGLVRPKGKPSVDKATLYGLYRDLRKKDFAAKPVLEDLIHRSRLRTIVQRYLDFPIDIDGRVRPRIKMIGAETGRFAYSDPAIHQFTPDISYVLVPAHGHVFVGADYSQIEARIQTYLAGVARDADAFAAGIDVHTITAREVFGLSEAEWEGQDGTVRKGMRNYAKSVRYRLMYGGDASQVGQLSGKVFCPCPRCAHLVPPMVNLPAGKITAAGQRFMANRPELERWREAQVQHVLRYRYLQTPMGRRRWFFGPVGAWKREAFNWPIQTTAAEVINRAMLTAWRRWPGAPFFLQWHDYLGLEVPEGEVELWSSRLVEVMEEPIPEMGGLSLPVELKVERAIGKPVT